MRFPDLRLAIAAAVAVLALAAAPARAADPLIGAVGDIACNSLPTAVGTCQQQATSDLLLGRPLTAVLPLGDNQYDGGALADFQTFYDPTWGRFKSITHPVAGNHEYRDTDAQGYFQYFGAAAGAPQTGYYSYDIGAWHLIALNSNCLKVGGCEAGRPEERWLKADLARTSSKACTLAYWHQPHFSSGLAGDDDGGQNPTLDFWNDLYGAGADVVLGGHDHDYERFGLQDPDGEPDLAFGIRQFVVGTGGKSHVRFGRISTNSQVRDPGTYGVLELTLHRASYDWRFVPAQGKVFTDSGTERCHGSPREPLIKVSRARKRLSRSGSLRLFAECAAICQTRAQVTVTIGPKKVRSLRVSRTLFPKLRSAVRIKFAKRDLRRIQGAFKRHKRLRAQVRVSASASGVRTGSATVKLRLRR